MDCVPFAYRYRGGSGSCLSSSAVFHSVDALETQLRAGAVACRAFQRWPANSRAMATVTVLGCLP